MNNNIMEEATKESDISCFAVDGVVAEMTIEVEENEHQVQKILKVYETEECKDLGESASELQPLKECDLQKMNDVSNDKLMELDNLSLEACVKVSEQLEKVSEQFENKLNNIETVVSQEEEAKKEVLQDKEKFMKADDENLEMSKPNLLEDKVDLEKEGEKEILSGKKTLIQDAVIQDSVLEKSKTDSLEEENEFTKEEEKEMLNVKETFIHNTVLEQSNTNILESEMKLIKDDNKEMLNEKDIFIHDRGINIEEPKQISKKGMKRKLLVDKDEALKQNPKRKKPEEGQYSMRKRKQSSEKTVSKVEETDVKKDTVSTNSANKSGRASIVSTEKSKLHLNNEVSKEMGLKLGNIAEVKKKVKKAKNLRSLYRIMFNKWCSNNREEVQEEILEFCGFFFGENSPELVKRKNIFKIMTEATVAEMCNILNLIKGPKPYMISSILKFLMKPHKVLDPSKDPSLQPVVILQRLSLENAYLSKASENYASKISNSKLKSSAPTKSLTGKSTPAKAKQSTQPDVKKSPPAKAVSVKSKKAKKNVKKQSLEKGKNVEKKVEIKSSEPVLKLKPVVEPSEKPKQVDKSQEMESSKNISLKESSVLIEDISKDIKDVSLQKSPSKKVGIARKGKPLRTFPGINDTIRKANFSALQRLHILLFGASEKAENLKSNILAFGGFPFLEGSGEWKQKHFVLSLLAQNTLKEYLDLLCIEHTNDEPSGMINKLMKFLAAPNENYGNQMTEIETEVVSSELTNNASVQVKTKATIFKKKLKKKEKKAAVGRPRKVLMDDVQVKRLEADIAREKRILAREKKLYNEQPKLEEIAHIIDHKKPINEDNVKSIQKVKLTKQPMTDPEKLNALLQTVYKRRALKAAGAVISIPNKGEKTRLGDLPNVKFLVVTANYNDLDILHHLIYMIEANKSKVRKNILDFDGFGFAEDSKKYNERIDFLNSLGYDVSKRIAFLLGLCPFKTDIPQQDLNELIMYFLMSPCKTKEVPITQMPHTLFTKDISKELGLVLKQNSAENSSQGMESSKGTSPSKMNTNAKNVTIKTPETSRIQNKLPIPKKPVVVPEKKILPIATPDSFKQKAKKSLTSSIKLSPVKKVVLSTQPSLSTNNIIRPSVATVNSNVGKIVQKQIVQKQIVLPQVTRPSVQLHSGFLPPFPIQRSILKAASASVMEPQEFLVQQQTPDGQQKTYKLIRLPPTHPLASAVVKPQLSQVTPQIPTQPLTTGISVSGTTLPPGCIMVKSNTVVRNNPNFHNVVQTVPILINQQCNATPIILSNIHTSVASSSKEEYVLPDAGGSKPSVNSNWNDDEVEILHPLEDNPPTDDQLFLSIQEIIHSSNFEDITLRNVIDRVSSQYSAFDLTHRHNFMKECVKKIIMGT